MQQCYVRVKVSAVRDDSEGRLCHDETGVPGLQGQEGAAGEGGHL